MEIFSALLAFCAGNSPVTGEFLSQRPVTRSFDVYFDLRMNKPLNKQSWGWWFETPSRSFWHHCNGPSFIVDLIQVYSEISRPLSESLALTWGWDKRADTLSTYIFENNKMFVLVLAGIVETTLPVLSHVSSNGYSFSKTNFVVIFRFSPMSVPEFIIFYKSQWQKSCCRFWRLCTRTSNQGIRCSKLHWLVLTI